MSKTRSVTDRVLLDNEVNLYLNDTINNLTLGNPMKKGSHRPLNSMLAEFVRKCSAMATGSAPPKTDGLDWKREFANETYLALKQNGVDQLIEEVRVNIIKAFPRITKDRSDDGIATYFYAKLATLAGMTARMLLYKLDPKCLIPTQEEEAKRQLRLLRWAIELGQEPMVCIH